MTKARHLGVGRWLLAIGYTILLAASAAAADVVDPTTLDDKVMCGYQGWFAAEGDGANMGWYHYAGRRGRLAPGSCTFDLWPDLRDFDEDEKFPTVFKHKDGSTAHLFSPYKRKTVVRHFAWMKEHGIDGVFLQRFGSSLKRDSRLNHRNVVMANVQAGARQHGRTWAIMYDLSGLKEGDIENYIMQDWKRLRNTHNIIDDPRYLRHNGKPVVAVWGVGFSDDRRYTLDECERLVTFLKHNPEFGGMTVMLGVPTHWRNLEGDALKDQKLHDIIRRADIVSPWTVGRYDSPTGTAQHSRDTMAPDMKWVKEQTLDYLPVIFPGFSWHNMKKVRGEKGKLDQIPRLNGRFLWSQAVAAKRQGANMLYVAMFDEIDEGTAIFKCTNKPPVGASPFLTYGGLRTDHYLWLTGQAGKLLRGEIPVTEKMPVRSFE